MTTGVSLHPLTRGLLWVLGLHVVLGLVLVLTGHDTVLQAERANKGDEQRALPEGRAGHGRRSCPDVTTSLWIDEGGATYSSTRTQKKSVVVL